MNGASTCKACGKPIIWMKTKATKNMPCDADLVPYWESASGTKRVLTLNGEIIKCELSGDEQKATGIGRTPHWGSCTSPDQFRKRGKQHETSRA
jgi:hypothetical protein